jgi:putative MFS transporter
MRFALTSRQRRILACCGLAALLAAMDGSVLFLVLPAVAAEYRAPVPSLANLGSAVALGSVGALPLALLADRRGRRAVLAFGTAAFGAADLLSAFAPSLAWLAAARIVAVAFEAAVAEIALIVVVEEMPPEHRGLGAAAMTLAAAAGAGIVVVAYPFLAPHWRVLYVAGAAALPAAVVIWRLLPETRVWEESRGLPALGWRGAWVRRLLIVAVSAALGAVLYEPAGLFLALYGSHDLHLRPAAISAVVFISGLLGLFAYPAGGWLTDRFGRRWLGVVLSAANALTAGAAFGGGLALYWAGNLVFSALNSAAGPVFGAWTTELFPTRARVTAEAVDVVAGALGGVAGLQLVAHFGSGGLGRAILPLTLFAVAGALILLLLPETGGQRLEA